MKALVKYASGKGNVEIRDLPVPELAPEEILVKVKYCGICGTDLHIFDDEFPNLPPVIMGHEYCGTVVKVGKAVGGEWSIGNRVVGELHTGACGNCELCRDGKPHICNSKLALGSKYNGAFAEYLAIPAWLAHRVPDGVPWQVAGVTEPFAITTHCVVERGDLRSGSKVLITGCATMGLMSTIWASRLGAKQIIVAGKDLDVERRFPLARNLGATQLVNVTLENLQQVLETITDGHGVDVWIECSGSVEAISAGLDLVKKTGKVILIGLVGPEKISVPWNTVLFRELDLFGCFSSPPSSWELALAAEKEESNKLKQLVTEILTLDEWEKGFDMMRKGEAVKILVDLEA